MRPVASDGRGIHKKKARSPSLSRVRQENWHQGQSMQTSTSNSGGWPERPLPVGKWSERGLVAKRKNTREKKKPNRARITSTRTAKHKEAELWMDITDNQEEDLKCLGKTELQTNCAYERWQNAQSKTRNPKQWENAQSKNVKSKRLWRLDSRKCHRIRPIDDYRSEQTPTRIARQGEFASLTAQKCCANISSRDKNS